MGFSSQEYWNELSCPPPEDLTHPGIEPVSLISPALASKCWSLSCVQLSVAPFVALQAPLHMGCPRPESWSRLPFPSPGDLPDPSIKPGFPALGADSLLSEQGNLCAKWQNGLEPGLLMSN